MMNERPTKLLRRPAVESRIGLKTTALYELMAEGKFPRPVRISKRAVGWPEDVVEAWIQDRIAAASAE
jgi:prophage regulatory protein